MANTHNIIVLCFIVFYLRCVSGDITWDNCNDDSNAIRLLNLTVKPYPVEAPGTVHIEVTVNTALEITGPVKADLTIYRKVLFGYVYVPCIDGIGSCDYDNLCNMCPQCICPLQPGDHLLGFSITIYVGSWAVGGTYQGQVNIQTHTGQKGCVDVKNVYIQSSK